MAIIQNTLTKPLFFLVMSTLVGACTGTLNNMYNMQQQPIEAAVQPCRETWQDRETWQYCNGSLEQTKARQELYVQLCSLFLKIRNNNGQYPKIATAANEIIVKLGSFIETLEKRRTLLSPTSPETIQDKLEELCRKEEVIKEQLITLEVACFKEFTPILPKRISSYGRENTDPAYRTLLSSIIKAIKEEGYEILGMERLLKGIANNRKEMQTGVEPIIQCLQKIRKTATYRGSSCSLTEKHGNIATKVETNKKHARSYIHFLK